MTPTITNRFVLLFNSNIGRVVRLSIPRACMDKAAAQAEASMNAIIANGAVLVENRGIPASIKGAKTIETTRREVA